MRRVPIPHEEMQKPIAITSRPGSAIKRPPIKFPTYNDGSDQVNDENRELPPSVLAPVFPNGKLPEFDPHADFSDSEDSSTEIIRRTKRIRPKNVSTSRRISTISEVEMKLIESNVLMKIFNARNLADKSNHPRLLKSIPHENRTSSPTEEKVFNGFRGQSDRKFAKQEPFAHSARSQVSSAPPTRSSPTKLPDVVNDFNRPNKAFRNHQSTSRVISSAAPQRSNLPLPKVFPKNSLTHAIATSEKTPPAQNRISPRWKSESSLRSEVTLSSLEKPCSHLGASSQNGSHQKLDNALRKYKYFLLLNRTGSIRTLRRVRLSIPSFPRNN
jgi:hypothetical protein